MIITEQNDFDFKAQLDDLNWLHSLKCVLLEQEPDPKYLTHNIKPEHLEPLFGTTDYTIASAEVDDQDILLEMKIKTEGIYFECMYQINLKSGTIDFELYMPYLVKKEYVIPDDMSPELAERVKKFMRNRFKMANFPDEEFNKYYSLKYMPVFINYAGYLEKLVKKKNCEGCAYLYPHRLSGFCNNFYKKNQSKDSE